MRTIDEIRNDIVEVKENIDNDTWNSLTALLDEVFLAYMIEARKHDVADILEEICHLERRCPNSINVHMALTEFKGIIEDRARTNAKMEYDTREFVRTNVQNWK